MNETFPPEKPGCQKTLGLSRAAALDFHSGSGDMRAGTDENRQVFLLYSFRRPETVCGFRRKLKSQKSGAATFLTL